jgi:flagellar basal-body rod modification protein FlgD
MEALKLSPEDLARSRNMADEVNKKMKSRGKNYGEPMGKDSFLKLLVTEIRHQDPTQPMADREFIAQMAQFSSLEQMQNMSTSMTSLNSKARQSEAYELIGRQIEAFNPASGRTTTGVVSHVVRSADDVKLMVNGTEVSLDDVHAVYQAKQPEQKQAEAPRAAHTPFPAFPSLQQSDQSAAGQTSQSQDNTQRAQALRAYDALSSTGSSDRTESTPSANQE